MALHVDQPPHAEHSSIFRFTLRTMFAITAALAVLFWTGMDSIGAMLLVGIPLALIGFGSIGGRKWNSVIYVLLIFWGGWTTHLWFQLPYWNCPIELPKSAKHLHIHFPESAPNSQISEPFEVRFDADVDDCIATAEKLAKKMTLYQKWLITNGDLKLTAPYDTIRDQSWFTIKNIQNGFCYENGVSELWVDSDRGTFYYRGTNPQDLR